ncbi:ABC transporter ATP-binding protein [Filifactor villosus]|uniref:ABC transporter ATP-binding protein n=1 Tax=Filifactor villosus TaxID=29374 RepID=A0ABV9QP16_9FIRM
MKKILIRANHISKSYSLDSLEVRALSDVSFDIYDGEFLVILGPSGSGKSTMLNIIGGMDTLTEGEFFFDDVPMHHSSEKQLTFYRRDNIGFVFQFYNLMSNLTALENVRLSVEIAKDPFDEREILSSVGLDDRLHHFPMQLSGGEQQRVALARALCKNPKLLLCDEPTGALDSKTSIEILKVLKDFNSVYKKTVVIITHNAAIANMADRVFYLKDGQLIRVQENAHPCPVEELEL